MQTLNIFGNNQNDGKGEEKVETHHRKIFGYTEDQYRSMCREYDLKWEAVKHLYERPKVNA